MLGMVIERDRKKKTIELNQHAYIKKMLEAFEMDECKGKVTPSIPNKRLDNSQSPQTDEERKEMETKPYRSLVGSLIHLANVSRFDISFAVADASRFLANPGPEHWKAAKRILEYVKTTMDYTLKYDGKAGLDTLICYSDADFANQVDTRRSQTGYIVLLANGAVSWKSSLQKTVALSTVEAEYMSASDGCKETIWTRSLLSELGFMEAVQDSTDMKNDNQGTIAIAKNPEKHFKTKHIDIRFHFLRERIERKEINLSYVATENMIADILTKGQNGNVIKKLCGKSGLGSKDEGEYWM